jgi:hypothetical protein
MSDIDSSNRMSSMTTGSIFTNVTVIYSAEWLASDTERSGLDRADVDVTLLTRVFEASLVAFVDAEEGVPITVLEDSAATTSYDILIDGDHPSDEISDQQLEYNTEKALERFFQLAAYWNEYRDNIG